MNGLHGKFHLTGQNIVFLLVSLETKTRKAFWVIILMMHRTIHDIQSVYSFNQNNMTQHRLISFLRIFHPMMVVTPMIPKHYLNTILSYHIFYDHMTSTQAPVHYKHQSCSLNTHNYLILTTTLNNYLMFVLSLLFIPAVVSIVSCCFCLLLCSVVCHVLCPCCHCCCQCCCFCVCVCV